MYSKAIKKYIDRDYTDDEIILEDDGSGIKIILWNVSGKTKPTISQLETIINDNKKDFEDENIIETLINNKKKDLIRNLAIEELINENKIEIINNKLKLK